jgi:predicted HTH domain antitoxin
MYENVGTRVSPAIIKDIEYVAKEEKTDKSKVVRELLSDAIKEKLVDLALEKYSKKYISLGKATELARLPLAEFMKVVAERKIPLNYSITSLEKDFASALKAK